jgi:hypothetical protein
VLLTNAKAGPVVLAAVLAAALVSGLLGRVLTGVLGERWRPWLGLSLWLAPVAAVLAVPGLHLSLTVRRFYLHGAGDIVQDHPALGVGTTGFRDAYLLVRAPAATESVISAHNAPADLAAMLGLAGLPWIAALVLCAMRSHPARRETTPTLRLTKPSTLLLAAWIVPPTLLSAVLESQATTIELALARLVGLCGWLGAAVLLRRVGVPVMGLAVAGLALLLHAQIDLVLFSAGAAPLGLCLVALGLRTVRQQRLSRKPPRPVAGLRRLAMPALVLAPVLAVQAWRVRGWESGLIEASGLAASFHEQRAALAQAGLEAQALYAASRQAAERLIAAADVFPDDSRPLQSAVRSALLAAQAARGNAVLTDEAQALALSAADAAVQRDPSSTTWSGLARVHGWLAARDLTPSASREHLLAAAQAWTHAVMLDPQGPQPAAELALTLEQLNDPRTAEQARLALALHAQTVLDPLAGLPEELVQRLRALAGTP